MAQLDPGRPLVTPGGRVGTLAAGVILRLVHALSPQRRRGLARLVGRLAFALRIRRQVTLQNLAHALPERSGAERTRIARAAYVNMAQAFLDGLGPATAPGEEPRVEVHGWEVVDRALSDRRGLLVAT